MSLRMFKPLSRSPILRSFLLNKRVFLYSTKELGKPSPIEKENTKFLLRNGPGLEHFLRESAVSNKVADEVISSTSYLNEECFESGNRKVYLDVYGCQMNVNDAEVVWSILKGNGYRRTKALNDADIVLVVTCAIREGAESKVWNKLTYLKGMKNIRGKVKGKAPMKIGVLGCMAERLKEKLLEKEEAVDLIAGPDSYKDLPRLLALTENNQKAVNVQLSFEETYADVTPVRLNQDSVTAFVSIMRGCDNMCTYCIVPFTRGRERSRPIQSILNEVRHLSDEGVKEITLLGQNVNSYRYKAEDDKHNEPEITRMSEGFRTVYKPKKGGIRFAELLDKVSAINPEMRVRFTSPHPKDFPDEVLRVVRERLNVCNNLHLPAQSGSSSVLERMGRGYTREAYLQLIDHVREVIPGVSLSSDFICGFCGETDEEFAETLTLMDEVEYNTLFIFPYSMREKTRAFHRLKDDVPQETKIKRLMLLQHKYRLIAEKLNKAKIGQMQLVLVEGESKRSKSDLAGRNDGGIKVIFPAEEIPVTPNSRQLSAIEKGNYVAVQIHEASCQVLKGKALYHTSLQEFNEKMSSMRRCLNC
ncbi:mitochondrial tRNA methylthiotransferase CDK5RAP1 [Ischnura elegans]|uniref:mitochondrial tRNA methylthiotransferase CDK5RAP1 n=1 Tax=Ischnura elegans TaxID=197161 RepID=UPI001ED870F7|nr:mitochondrial tRNA methylthiotransferase CDK5RAP1 [Ischnura elegans]